MVNIARVHNFWVIQLPEFTIQRYGDIRVVGVVAWLDVIWNPNLNDILADVILRNWMHKNELNWKILVGQKYALFSSFKKSKFCN